VIISRTPYRISFFGGGTDYPVWFKEHGGAVLGTTIDKYCYLSVRWLPAFFEHKHRIVYSKTELPSTVEEILHPSVRECLKFLGISAGIAISHDGDLPARRGMGSSSAFTVGLLHALHVLQGRRPWKEELASEAMHVEQIRIGENVGCQDQILTTFGGFNHVVLTKEGQLSVIRINGSKLEPYLMLFDTRTSRIASTIAEEQIKQTPHREHELEKIQQMVDIARELLAEGDFLDFGDLLNETWQYKKSLTKKISTPEIDDAYNKAIAAGAIGGKLLGAGGGGFMLFFVEPEKQKKVKEALSGLTHVPFRFENTGSQIIFGGS